MFVLPHLSELLDRRVAFVLAAPPRLFRFELARFITWGTGHPIIGAHLEDLHREQRRDGEQHAKELLSLLRDAGDLRTQLATLPPAGAAPGLEPGDEEDSFLAFDGIVQGLKAPEPPARREALTELCRILKARSHDLPKTHPLVANVHALDARREQAAFAASVFNDVSPAASAGILGEIAKLAASPISEGPLAGLREGMRRAELLEEGSRRSGRPLQNDSVLDGLRLHLNRVYEELRMRIGAGLSHRALVARFQTRSMSYDRDRLRDIVVRDGKFVRDREDRLVLELAKYLHDGGLQVLVGAQHGNIELDIQSPELLVEGKAYKGSARARLIAGIAEMYSYLTRIEGTTREVHEAFYVVFRLGGPLYLFPPEIRTPRYIIYPTVVDLALGPETGSRQKKSEEITEEEIKQRLSVVDGPKRQKSTPSSKRSASDR